MHMATENIPVPVLPLDALGLGTESLTLMLEGASIELMKLLDLLEEEFGLNVADDERFAGANRILGLYILMRAGDKNLSQFLPELRTYNEEMRRLLVEAERQSAVGQVQ